MEMDSDCVDLILSDIPYGIGAESWDVLHANTNSAYLGSSAAQEQAGAIFKRRGKPLNGWSVADREISRQYYEWVCMWAPACLRVLKPGATAMIFAGRRLSHRAICAFEDAGFTYKDMIAWDKGKAAHRAQRLSVVYERRADTQAAQKWVGWKLGNLRPCFEPILWFTKPYRLGGTIADNVLKFGVGAYNEEALTAYQDVADNIVRVKAQATDTGLHPTQKPLALMELLIELVTCEGQMVLDPFCGSGTTLLAAQRLGRQYVGIEKEERYFLLAKRRLDEARRSTESQG